MALSALKKRSISGIGDTDVISSLRSLRRSLPEGGKLPEFAWEARHGGIVALLWLHVPAILLFGVAVGLHPAHVGLETVPIASAALLAKRLCHHRTASTVVASIGLMTCSAVLVHLSGGVIEAHFHFFVMVTIIILYQDWVPFLLSIAYVVAHHALFGLIDPTSVFNHPAAIENPVKWAVIHGVFILGATVAGLTVWKQNESLRDSYQDAARRLAEAETRQRDALDLNDNVLQNLAVADYAFEMGLPDKGQEALKRSLSATQKIVSDLLEDSMQHVEPGDLVRAEAVGKSS